MHYNRVMFSDVNNTELFDAEPRLLVIDAEPRRDFHFQKKKRSRVEPRL